MVEQVRSLLQRLIRFGRRGCAVMAPGDHTELQRVAGGHPMALGDPLLDEKLPGQPVRGKFPVVAVFLGGEHAKAGVAHVPGPVLDLTGERGCGLSDVVARRGPHDQPPPVLRAGRKRRRNARPDRVGQPLVPQPAGDRAAVRHVPPQRQPRAVQRACLIRLAPGGARRLRQRPQRRPAPLTAAERIPEFIPECRHDSPEELVPMWGYCTVCGMRRSRRNNFRHIRESRARLHRRVISALAAHTRRKGRLWASPSQHLTRLPLPWRHHPHGRQRMTVDGNRKKA